MPALPTKEKRQEMLRKFEKAISKRKAIGAAYGLVKGLSITMKTMLHPAITAQYPHQKPDLPPRTRGVIALKEENCTVCMLCSRECPDWCIYIDSHKEVMPPKTPGARSRTRNVLDRFAIDYALCMYCGICVEVCPFDALFWSPHFEYSTADMSTLTHEMPTLTQWMDLVPPPPSLEVGAEPPVEEKAEPKVYGGGPVAAASGAVASPAGSPTSLSPAVEPPAPEQSQEAATPAAPVAVAEKHDDEPPQIDEETYKAQLAAGKSEREARAMAKKAWVLKRRKG